MSPQDKLYWFKLLMAFIAALITVLFKLNDWAGLLFGFLMLFVAHYTAKLILRISPSDFGNSEAKMLFSGSITYYIAFLLFWIVLYDLFFL
ncbi:MAG: hypothetical protein ACP6IS_05610 [Candidatus Asgardarchaeia archaeon]